MDYQQLKKIQQVFWRHLKPAIRSPGAIIQLIRKVLLTISSGRLPNLIRRYGGPKCLEREYAQWVQLYDSAPIRQETLAHRPLFSALMVVDTLNTSDSAVRSILRQTYTNWQLLISLRASDDGRAPPELFSQHDQIKWFPANNDTSLASSFEKLLAESAGEWVLILTSGTILSDQALYFMAAELNRYPAAEIIYSDEDGMDKHGKRCNPNFKPDWNPLLLLSQNYMGKGVAYQKARLQAAGGFKDTLNQMLEWDLALRMTDFCKAEHIRHIPRVLSHGVEVNEQQLNPSDTARFKERILTTHFLRVGRKVSFIKAAGERLRIQYALPSQPPQISIIIPTRDNFTFLTKCVHSIIEKTTYPNYEIIVVDNQSRDAKTLQYLSELETRGQARVLCYDAPFNYSAINNFAVGHAKGELLALVNDDIEVISPDWLEEMAGYAIQPETGAVGAMLFYPDDTIQHAGMVLGLHGVSGHIYSAQPKGYAGYQGRGQVPQNFSAITAACILLRRDVYLEIRGLDEQFPIACNDVDLCLRLLEKAYWNVWTPYAEFYHHESVTRGYDDSLQNQRRAKKEIACMQHRWGSRLVQDPAYNPNLSLETDFVLAFPPRLGTH